jgi:hypothetical protein
MAIVSIELNERVAKLRERLNSSPEGRVIVQRLVPTDRLQSAEHKAMDFCDWQQFSQWPQSGIDL